MKSYESCATETIFKNPGLANCINFHCVYPTQILDQLPVVLCVIKTTTWTMKNDLTTIQYLRIWLNVIFLVQNMHCEMMLVVHSHMLVVHFASQGATNKSNFKTFIVSSTKIDLHLHFKEGRRGQALCIMCKQWILALTEKISKNIHHQTLLQSGHWSLELLGCLYWYFYAQL